MLCVMLCLFLSLAKHQGTLLHLPHCGPDHDAKRPVRRNGQLHHHWLPGTDEGVHGLLVRLVREDHGHLHLSWEAGGGEVSRFVKPAVAHHDLAHDGKDAEELLGVLRGIEREKR